MKRWLARIGLASLVLSLFAFVALAVWEPFFGQPGQAPPPARYKAEIVRDEFGVPHIYGERDVDVSFGIAFAHSEDDFSTLQDVIAMTRGRFGAIAGEEGAAVDFTYHLLDARGTAERDYAKLPADVRALLEAYSAGLNTYARDHPAELKLGNLFPVNGIDIAAGFALRQPFFFGLDKIIAPLAEGKEPPVDFGPVLDASKLGNPVSDTGLEGGDRNGSNAFAIAPARSGDGATRLVSNTHQPWRGPVAWYELVVESGEGWHFAGATFPGAPFPLLGHNENLGWTNTVNRPDLVDVYRLVLDESGTKYHLDGKWKVLDRKDVLLPVKVGPVILPVRRSVWRSEHGPVIKTDEGEAFAIRYGGMDRIDQLTEYFRLNKARNYEEWRSALAMQAVPSTNFIYADREGHIAYHYNASIPERAEGPDWRRIVPGDRSDLIWRAMVPFEQIPHYLDPASGFLWNANNTPYRAAGASDLSSRGVPALWGVELTMTNRARRAERLFAQTDLIGPKELETIKYDTAWERAGYVARLLDGIAALDLSDDPLLARAQALLATWDFNSDGQGGADALALLVLREATSADYNNRADPDPREQISFAAHHLIDHFGRLDPPMGQVQRLRLGPGPHAVDMPYDGGSDTLRAASNWDIDPDGRLRVKHGDSFVMFIEWPGNGPVRSFSIMPFGSATTRPHSVHYTDQSALFVAKKLKPVRFERFDAIRNAVRRYQVTGD